MAQPWSTVERQHHLAEIRSVLATEHPTCGVLLTGPAGVGKTTLARAATGALPGAVAWVAGTESAQGIPLGVFAHLVRPSTTRDPVTLMAAARESLVVASNLVLCVDDAHLLDRLSATLLLQLATDRAAQIVAVVRSGEAVPAAVTALWKDGHLTRIELDPFSREQSVELIESTLGGQLEALSADLIWQASGGNALYLRHLVDGALDSGALRSANGVWQLRGRAAITTELDALLAERIGKLAAAVVRVLQIVALCEPIDLDLLAELATDEALDDAERAGLIQITPLHAQPAVRLAHPLFGEVARRRLGSASARRLRGQLVAALQHRGARTAAERVRLAELALDSDHAVDPTLLDTAAADAIALANLPLAERLTRTTVARTGAFESSDMLARTLLWQGAADEVESIMAGFDPTELDPVQLVRWGLTRAANLHFAIGAADRADRILTLVRSRTTNPKLLGVLDGVASAFAFHENRLDDADAAAQRVFGTPALPWAIEWAAFGGGRTLAISGRGSQVPAIAERMHAVADRCDGLLRFPAALAEIQALTLMGEIGRADRLAAGYFGFAAGGHYLAWALASTLAATVEVAAGRFGAAVVRLEQTLAAFPDRGAASWNFPARILLIQTLSVLGRADRAEAVLDAAHARDGRHVAVFRPQLQIAQAWLAAARGTVRTAVELAQAAAVAARQSGQYAIEGEALNAAARFGDHTAASRLVELAGQIDGRLIGLHARHAAALAAGDGAELDRVATEYEQTGTLLCAADAAAQAAARFEATGNRRGLVDAAARANRLAAECGGIATPAVSAAAQPLPITPREREVANLVAARLTDREIAERLTLSVRTVENHVYQARTKLGVPDRESLAALILQKPQRRRG